MPRGWTMDSRTTNDTDPVDAFTALVVAFAERQRPTSRDAPNDPAEPVEPAD